MKKAIIPFYKSPEKVSNIMKKSFFILLTILSLPVIAQAQSLNIEISSGISIEMIQCPKENNKSRNDFYISKLKTDQALYKELMGENPSVEYKNDTPAGKISNTEAIEFFERLNEITSDVRPSGYEFRMPTEQQLEYTGNTTDSASGFRVALVSNTELSVDLNPAETLETVPAPATLQTEDITTHPAVTKAGEKISIAVKSVKFPLICCPAGSFTMGSPANEPCHTDKEKQKQINFEKEFFIGKYEITQGQYVTVMGNNPSVEIGDKLPVHNVSWSDAQKFCEKLNELTLDSRPEGTLFTLPTEAQWEYACRSGYTTALNNGKNLVNLNAEDQELNQLAWYEANSSEKIQTVGKKVANAWGIHDMHGNVWEWCSDKGADITMFGKQHSTRVARGGSFKSKANECRAANHRIFRENPAQTDFGFRIVLIKQK